MKWTLAIALCLLLLLAAPVNAGSFGVSPSHVEITVPARGEASVEFTFYDFTGDIKISTEDIPLRTSPGTASISPGNDKLVLTFYGDGSIVSRTYEGKILFVTAGADDVNMGLKVKARVSNIAEGPLGGQGMVIALAAAGALVLGGGAFILRRSYIRRRG